MTRDEVFKPLLTAIDMADTYNSANLGRERRGIKEFILNRELRAIAVWFEETKDKE